MEYVTESTDVFFQLLHKTAILHNSLKRNGLHKSTIYRRSGVSDHTLEVTPSIRMDNRGRTSNNFLKVYVPSRQSRIAQPQLVQRPAILLLSLCGMNPLFGYKDRVLTVHGIDRDVVDSIKVQSAVRYTWKLC